MLSLTVSSQFGDKSMESQSGSSSKLFIHFAVLVDKGLGKRLSLALQDCHMCVPLYWSILCLSLPIAYLLYPIVSMPIVPCRTATTALRNPCPSCPIVPRRTGNTVVESHHISLLCTQCAIVVKRKKFSPPLTLKCSSLHVAVPCIVRCVGVQY